MNKFSRNERIVSLTQSEIMLVLAVIILLLLLVKSADFSKVRTAIMGAEAAQPTTLESSEPPPSEREVVGTLVRKAESGRAALDALEVDDTADADKAREVVEELKLRAEAAGQPQIDGAQLNRENEELHGDNKLLRNQLRKQKTDEEEARAANAELRAENKQLQKNNESLQLTIAGLQEKLQEKNGGTKSPADKLRDKIGCLPCWRGDGKPFYYFAYDITHKEGRYHVKPHRDLRNGAYPVDKSLAGALNNYPHTPVAGDKFLEFARTITAAKNSAHGEECQLMVHLNKKADGTIVEFLRDKAGFCPIYK